MSTQVQAGSVAGEGEPMWSVELDALVAAPNHHLLLMDNERVRVVGTRIAAGTAHRCILTAGPRRCT
ncbi:MAG: hypothetical protein ACJ78Q_14010 [Chloroflexia bacterium]